MQFKSTPALVLALAVAGPAIAAEELLMLEDVFELETASDPQISPDGGTIVYVRTTPDIMSDQNTSKLWAVGVDADRHRPLTTGKSSESSPRWSPTGDRLAYVSTEEGSSQIWLRYMDSGQTARLTHHEHPPSGISWSPDGNWLAFTALVPEEPTPIAELPVAPEGAEWAPPAKIIDRLLYKFDPVGYLDRGQWQVFVVPADGGTARQLTDTEHGRFGAPGLGRGSPVWTPDGKAILISANLRPESDLEPRDSEVYEISVATGEYRALTDRRGPDDGVVVSPDGRRIAFVGFDDRYQGYQLTNLYLAKRDGSEVRQLARDLGRSVENPRFSPDGSSLYVNYTSEGRSRIGVVSSGRLEEIAIDVGGEGASAYAGETPVSVARNGRLATITTDPQSPGDVAVIESDGVVRKLTAINRDLLGHKALGTVEEIWYESSHDGRRVQGWILKPPFFDPDERYPLILEIHGGPFAAYGPKFGLEHQLMAARGYVVLFTNPRGSTSYGEEFGNLIHHAYPGDDFFDLMSGVDAVIAKGYIDPEHLYVTGGSGGGVLTSWVIGRTDRFRAAVTVYPVINWYSWVLTADLPSLGVRYWFPGLPWDHVEHYESRSLLSVVENVTTPTMILTGESDYRTPMSDSEQYFTALKLLGVEAVLVRVPEENHGIRKRPSHWQSKIAHIIGWMEKHRQAAEEDRPRAKS